MDLQRLTNMDLNLLVALHTLLEERSVTGAAERLGRSQPSLSTALKRLRTLFDDDLLVRVGNTYELSPLAVRLVQRTALALADLERVFTTRVDFDPAESEREFVLATSDYGASVMGAAIDRRLTEAAPGATLRFEQIRDEVVDNHDERMRAIDGIMIPHGFLEDVPHVDLYRDEWVLLVSADNQRVGEAITMEDLATLPWVLTFHRPTAFTPPARQLRMLGVQLKADVVVQGFLPVPTFIEGTDRVAFLQRQLAARVGDPDRFRVLPCPFDVVPLVEAMWWHPVFDQDPGHVWFRSLVAQAASDVHDTD